MWSWPEKEDQDSDGVLSMDLREGWHSGRESAGVLLLLYSRSRNSEVLHRLQWLPDLDGKELSAG